MIEHLTISFTLMFFSDFSKFYKFNLKNKNEEQTSKSFAYSPSSTFSAQSKPSHPQPCELQP